MVGHRLHGVGDEEGGGAQGELDGDPGRVGGMGGVAVEAQGAEAQVGGLAEQVEQLRRVEAEVAIVYAAQVVVVGRGRGVSSGVQVLLGAATAGLGGVQRAGDVLARVSGAELGDGQAAGLVPDMLTTPCSSVHQSSIVLERSQQTHLQCPNQLLPFADDARQRGGRGRGGGGGGGGGRRMRVGAVVVVVVVVVGGGGWLGVASGGIALQCGHSERRGRRGRWD